MKMIIIGAGIAGTMAYNYFRKYSPVVYEAKPNRAAFIDSDAIIRMKDLAISYLFGTEAKEIEVEKWIHHEGRYYSSTNPFFSCSYSQKVTGTGALTSRSIENLGKVKRYLINPKMNIPEDQIKFGKIFYGVCSDSRGKYASFNQDEVIEYDVLISTIPMSVMLLAGGLEIDDVEQPASQFWGVSIYTKTFSFQKIFSVDKYYTVYVPDQNTDIYRVNLSPDGIKFEAVYDYCGLDDETCIYAIEEMFGISERELDIDPNQKAKKIGENKIKGIDAELRKRILYQLTSRHNIYSLGRYAIWKNIGVDDLMKDIKRIDQMISAQSDVLNYDMHGGKI